MKFSCTKENLAQALALVSGVSGKNINLPILNNILIKADQQKIELTATNLELAVLAVVRSKTEQDGTFTVPARTLADFVNLLPNEKVDVGLLENELTVSCGQSATKIKGAPAEEFPIVPVVEDGKGFLIDATTLKIGLAQVLPAVAKNDIRPELAGLFFGFNIGGNPGLMIAATDSYRLAEKKVPLVQGSDELKVIVPARTAQEMYHILSLGNEAEAEKHVRLMVTENQITLNYNSVQVVSRLVEGNYPDYTQIIPKDFKTTVTIPTERLVKEMKAAGLFTTSGVNAVTVEAKPAAGVLEVTSTSTQTGEYASEAAAEITGEVNRVLLNNRYVLDGLNNMAGDEVALKIINGDSPCVLVSPSDPSYQYIVMPIRQ